MAELKDLMAYLIGNYPRAFREELSNARLTKMIYLTDWRHILESGSQVTDIDWYFDSFGPFVHDIQNTARSYPELFSVHMGTNYRGQPKRSFLLKSTDFQPNLSESEKEAADHIIKVTQRLYWDDFIKLVYSTHPVASAERYTYLDLVSAAEEYQPTRNKM